MEEGKGEASKPEPGQPEKKPETRKSETYKVEPVILKSLSEALQITHIALDNYDDIFSDFDPSPYATRILSDDFLNELRRRYAERGKGEFVVNFTIQKELRSDKTEALIKKRIKDYFKAKMKTLEKARKESVNKGILRFMAGLVVSLGILFVPALETTPLITLLSVLTWFLLWTGYDHLFEAAHRLRKRKAFYEKFLKADYKFMDEEKVMRGISSSYR